MRLPHERGGAQHSVMPIACVLLLRGGADRVASLILGAVRISELSTIMLSSRGGGARGAAADALSSLLKSRTSEAALHGALEFAGTGVHKALVAQAERGSPACVRERAAFVMQNLCRGVLRNNSDVVGQWHGVFRSGRYNFLHQRCVCAHPRRVRIASSSVHELWGGRGTHEHAS